MVIHTEPTTATVAGENIQFIHVRALLSVALFAWLGRVQDGFLSSLFIFVVGFLAGQTHNKRIATATQQHIELARVVCLMGLQDVRAAFAQKASNLA